MTTMHYFGLLTKHERNGNRNVTVVNALRCPTSKMRLNEKLQNKMGSEWRIVVGDID